jgi:hypothetical protein
MAIIMGWQVPPAFPGDPGGEVVVDEVLLIFLTRPGAPTQSVQDPQGVLLQLLLQWSHPYRITLRSEMAGPLISLGELEYGPVGDA